MLIIVKCTQKHAKKKEHNAPIKEHNTQKRTQKPFKYWLNIYIYIGYIGIECAHAFVFYKIQMHV